MEQIMKVDRHDPCAVVVRWGTESAVLSQNVEKLVSSLENLQNVFIIRIV